MNINNFNVAMHAIRRGVDFADFKLEYDKKFPYKTRRQFNESLVNLEKLLKNDVDYTFAAGPLWHTARRIVQFKELYAKIEGIRTKIICSCQKPYFVEKIGSDILPVLTNRIKVLKSDIGKKGRLPFSVGEDRAKFHSDIQQSLQMKNVAKIRRVQKEYFHLMGNHFDKDIKSEINIEAYTGSLEVYSLESWEKVIKLFIDKGADAEKEIGGKILGAIQRALPLAVKTSFAYNLSQIRKPSDETQELAYLIDLVDSKKALVEGEVRKITPKQLLQKYKLAKVCSIPDNVIINEMAWDMVENIQKLSKGDFQLFTLGTCSHSIAVQVTCIEAVTLMNEGSYEYTIFNSGDQVKVYHQLDEAEVLAYPLTFVKLPLKAFSYTFCYDLIYLSLKGKSVPQFYTLHDTVLVEQFGGSKVKKSGALYHLQKFGTCTYSAIEVWIESFLNLDQQYFLKLVKMQLSTSKQEEVVKILEKEEKLSNLTQINSNRKRKREFILETPVKRRKILKENKLLLDKGRKSLEILAKSLMR